MNITITKGDLVRVDTKWYTIIQCDHMRAGKMGSPKYCLFLYSEETKRYIHYIIISRVVPRDDQFITITIPEENDSPYQFSGGHPMLIYARDKIIMPQSISTITTLSGSYNSVSIEGDFLYVLSKN